MRKILVRRQFKFLKTACQKLIVIFNLLQHAFLLKLSCCLFQKHKKHSSFVHILGFLDTQYVDF